MFNNKLLRTQSGKILTYVQPCVIMPDGCGINTTEHPRWTENATHYGTNNFRFNALPGGGRFGIGSFLLIGGVGYWWSSTEDGTNIAWTWGMDYSNSTVGRRSYGKELGFSVRCLKDYTGTQPNGTILPNDYTDGDGNTYDAVVIGEQLWTVENLYTTKYQNGTNIPNVTDNNTWRGLTTGAYCWYNNDESTYSVYGALYNWYAVDNGLVDNNGYRVPSNADWTQLTDYLINENWCNDVVVTSSNVAQYLKSCRQVNHPIQPNTTTQNTTGESVWFEINDVKYYPESDTDEFLIDYEIGDVIKMSRYSVEHLYINGEQVAESWYYGDPPIEYTITESVISVVMHWFIA